MLDRQSAAMFIGAIVHIAKEGSSFNSATVDGSALPSAPTSASPGPWISLGKIRSLDPSSEKKSSDVEGCSDAGIYVTEEVAIATKQKIAFTTNDIAPEAFRLTWGLKEDIVDGTSQLLFGAGRDSFKCWLRLDLRDSLRDGREIGVVSVYGELALANPLKAASDPATAEYEFRVKYNPLNSFDPRGIVDAPAGS